MNNSDETQATKPLGQSDQATDRWEKVSKIFEAASVLTGKEREKFLKKSCGTDAELREEVEQLLESSKSAESFLENPAVAEVASLFENKKTLIGHQTTGEVKNGKLVAGTVLASRYRILGLLGKGGMGEVYQAEDIKLSQTVALKFLPDKLQKDSAALERFHAEVRHARQISHPNVCRVFDIGEIDGKHFLSMEFVDGDDLSSLLRRVGRLSSERATEISRQLCVGLEAIHNAGILHRDFKPANVIIDSKGKARITDFGIAGLAEEAANDPMRVGTPAYMSPEQIRGKNISTKSDIYALGLVLYEIFTGKQAFEADSIPELIKKHTEETPTNPSDFVKGIDPLVEQVIKQCLEKDPLDRPASALHVALALPGGNPMQIALDAGQTPSPEMVAAAPKKGVLKPLTAAGLVAAGLIFLAIYFSLNVKIEPQHRIPFEKSDEVLSLQANEIIKKFGYTNKPVDKWNAFFVDLSYRTYIWNNQTPENVEKVSTGQPMFFQFMELHSLSRPFRGNIGGYWGFYMPQAPPDNTRQIILDTRGRLVYFDTTSPEFIENPRANPEPDWSPAFSAAELDLSKFKEVQPKWFPDYAYDTHKAWEGVMPDHPEFPLRVEAAGFQGKIVYFILIYPWTVPEEAQQETEQGTWTIRQWIGMVFFQITSWGYLVIILFLAYKNLKSGSADRKGAFKFAAIPFVAMTLGNFLMINTSLSRDLFFSTLEKTIYIGLTFYLLYIALEPFVRRRLPELIVSWNRVLAGDWRDPLVGRDVLVGAVFGIGTAACYPLATYLDRYLFNDFHLFYNGWAFPGLKNSFILFFRSIDEGIYIGGTVVFVFTILFIIIRRKNYAAVAYFVAAVVYQTLQFGSVNFFVTTLPVILITTAFSALLVSRFGFLTMFIANFVFMLTAAMTTADLSAWYAKAMILSYLTILFLFGYGFKISTANQPLFGKG